MKTIAVLLIASLLAWTLPVSAAQRVFKPGDVVTVYQEGAIPSKSVVIAVDAEDVFVEITPKQMFRPSVNDRTLIGGRSIAWIISRAAVVCAVVLFGWGISFAFRRFPAVPDASTGRVYPLNNHGSITYLTRQENLEQDAAFIGAGIVFMVGWGLDRMTTRSSKYLPVLVECEADVPKRIRLDEHVADVVNVLDEWTTSDFHLFKVRTSTNDTVVLRERSRTGTWDLTYQERG